MQTKPKIAIVYLSYHCEPYMEDVINSLKTLTYPRECVEFVVIDNPHPQHGPSMPYLNEHLMPLSGKEIPHITLLPQEKNLGFSGGNNAGIQWALENGFDYVYFHNNDGYMAPGCLEPLVEALEADPKIGAAQSLMLLHPETTKINSAGNSFHFLGFGYCDEYKKDVSQVTLPPIKDIGYASGAAIFMRTSLLKGYGLWDNDFFLYHEDTEYSFRLRAAGYRVVLVRDSVFYHKYQFNRSIQKYYWMERNRYAMILMFYSVWTMLLFLPIAIPVELGSWLFAFKGGWWKERLKAWSYWLAPSSWRLWLGKRRRIQSIRKISDKEMLRIAVTKILFQEEQQQNPLVTKFANPVMDAYFKIVMRLLV